MTHIDLRDAELNARLEKSVLDCIALNFDNLTGADLRRAVFNADTAIRDTALRLSRCSTQPCIIAAQQVLIAARNVLAKAIADGIGNEELFKRDVQRNMPKSIEILEAELAKHVPTCGACGGEGNCPDCMIWDAPLTEVLAETPRDTDAYEALEAAILAAYPAVEIAPICPHCDGNDWDCQACNAVRLKAKQTTPVKMTVIEATGGDDILARIEARTAMISRRSWASGGEDEAMELAQEAADEIRALRAEIERLEAASMPEPTFVVKFDSVKQGWVWVLDWYGLEATSGDAFLSPESAHENAVAYIKSLKANKS